MTQLDRAERADCCFRLAHNHRPTAYRAIFAYRTIEDSDFSSVSTSFTKWVG
jgi:hypothetical protein